MNQIGRIVHGSPASAVTFNAPIDSANMAIVEANERFSLLEQRAYTLEQSLAAALERVGELENVPAPNLLPIASVAYYMGDVAPDKWAFARGDSLLISEYPEIYAIIGTRFGSVDIDHFNLPNWAGKVIYGAGVGVEYGIFSDVGSEGFSILIDNLPSHSHVAPAHVHAVSGHTHTLASHSHSVSGHTHYIQPHTHGQYGLKNVASGQFNATGVGNWVWDYIPNSAGQNTDNGGGGVSGASGILTTGSAGAQNTALNDLEDTQLSGGDESINFKPTGLCLSVIIKLKS